MIELLLQSARAGGVLQAVTGSDMSAPDLLNVEVVAVLRRLEREGAVRPSRADQAVDDLVVAPIRRWPTVSLVVGAWKLRQNLSAYDALYVALARTLACPLVTGDLRLARAPGLGVPVVTV